MEEIAEDISIMLTSNCCGRSYVEQKNICGPNVMDQVTFDKKYLWTNCSRNVFFLIAFREINVS